MTMVLLRMIPVPPGRRSVLLAAVVSAEVVSAAGLT